MGYEYKCEKVIATHGHLTSHRHVGIGQFNKHQVLRLRSVLPHAHPGARAAPPASAEECTHATQEELLLTGCLKEMEASFVL